MRLIVPMGGRGTRLRPLSHTTPKALLPVVGRPAVERALGAFADALPRPVEEAVFVLNPADHHTDVPDRLAEACAAVGVRAAFATQTEPLGTAHAVGSAGDKLDGEILTCWSDTLFRPARRADLDSGPADLVAWTLDVADPRRFGVVARDGDGRVTGLLEKPPDARFTETLIGAYYVRDGAALRAVIDRMVAEARTGAGGEYQLTDALDALVQGGARVQTEPVDEWLDVGTVPAYLDCVARTLDREGGAPADAEDGVTLVPPVFVAPGAVVRRSTVGPYAAVEAGATVEASEVRSAVVFAGAEVRRSQLDGAVLGHRAAAVGHAGSALLGDDAAVGRPLEARSPLAD
jgi:glucose-1-phosphate thymidylyltransferase